MFSVVSQFACMAKNESVVVSRREKKNTDKKKKKS